MTWRSILISRPAKLSLQKRHMLIQQNHEVAVPLEDIAVIVVESKEVVMTAPLLSALAQSGTTLLTCDETFMPCGQWLPFSQHHRYLKIVKLQIAITEPKKKQLWQKIVRQKILNQAWVARYHGFQTASKKLDALAERVQSGDKKYAEGQAAALYFHTLFGKDFNRNQENEINSSLNYGYAVIRAAIARSLTQHGFLPCLGIHHRSELNAFNLADDMIEPFRPLVDLWVMQHVAGNTSTVFGTQTKQSLIGLLHHQMRFGNRIYSVLSAIDRSIESLQAAFVENDSNLLQLPSTVPLREHTYD